MITIKTDAEIELLRQSGKILSNCLKEVEKHIRIGVTTKELDTLAHDFIIKHDAYPTCLGFEGFPASICTSINDCVVHGIPSNRKLKNGDIITIDLVVGYKGYQADAAYTYSVGKISDDDLYLLKHTEASLYEGIKMVKPGNRIGDISHAIEVYAHKHNLGIVEELCGHGIGQDMHEDPDVPNYGEANTGVRLKEGMVICIEPMLTFGKRYVYLMDDDWTVKTDDGSNAAHFEHTVLVTSDGYRILTPREDDKLYL